MSGCLGFRMEGRMDWEGAKESFLDDGVFCTDIVVVVPQANTCIKLYMLNGCILLHINYILLKFTF